MVGCGWLCGPMLVGALYAGSISPPTPSPPTYPAVPIPVQFYTLVNEEYPGIGLYTIVEHPELGTTQPYPLIGYDFVVEPEGYNIGSEPLGFEIPKPPPVVPISPVPEPSALTYVFVGFTMFVCWVVYRIVNDKD